MVLFLLVWPGLVAPAAAETSLVPLEKLHREARVRLNGRSRLPLEPATSERLRNVATWEDPERGRLPNYLRAAAYFPGGGAAFARLTKAVLYGGDVEPETKMAMGLRIAQVYGSPYTAAHAERFLRASERGRALRRELEAGPGLPAAPAAREAIGYAERLTRDIHGVSDENFRQLRGYYHDSQVVELTLVVSYFHYFMRLAEALSLPVEIWALESAVVPPVGKHRGPVSRVGLIEDGEIEWAVAAGARGTAPARDGLGLGVVNSQRAMYQSPEIAAAWRSYGAAVRENAQVSREILLQVSFAVSMANGCRYGTLHQVQGLRRLGVSPAKLLQMKKDDSALTAREKVAVQFARQLTRDPVSVTDEDYRRLRGEFGEQGALEVVLQTCNFAFMNRFTDGLRLPPEDEAVRTYREVYGADWK